MRILVVEDEKVLCDTIVRSLSRLAYSVDFCYDGGSAMELLAVENYDLVVLDLNLPDADGMTVLTTLPVMFVFPLVQKYFVKGMTIGAVKG